MNPFDLRPLGRTGIKLTALGLGGIGPPAAAD